MEGEEEERRLGVLGKSLGESHWLAPLLLGGEEPPADGMDVSRVCIQPS